MLKISFYSSLPFLLVSVFLCGFSFSQWSPIYWFEQMWKSLVSSGWWERSYVVSLVSVLAHCWAPFEEPLLLCIYVASSIFCYGHLFCALTFPSRISWITVIVKTYIFLFGALVILKLCDASFVRHILFEWNVTLFLPRIIVSHYLEVEI